MIFLLIKLGPERDSDTTYEKVTQQKKRHEDKINMPLRETKKLFQPLLLSAI